MRRRDTSRKTRLKLKFYIRIPQEIPYTRPVLFYIYLSKGARYTRGASSILHLEDFDK